nr:carbonyl reductase 1 [Hymenolepis microstoma]
MRVAVVTGSNKGVGNGIIELLAKNLDPKEWHVYLTARNVELGEKAVKRFRDQGLEVKFHQLDITNKDSRHALVEFIKKEYPNGLDILVNNAGIAYKMNSTAPFAEQARVTIATNYTGTVDMCLDFLPIMAKGSRLVNVASIAAQRSFNALTEGVALKFLETSTIKELDDLMNKFIKYAEAGDHQKKGYSNSAYGMSKIGVWRATQIFATQYKSDPRHILINSCCPGFVSTDMSSYSGEKTILEGADTPFYLATLPEDTTEPYGEFVSDRQVVKVDARFR